MFSVVTISDYQSCILTDIELVPIQGNRVMLVLAMDTGLVKSIVLSLKINIDENPQAPANFSIRSIPTMILFKDGSMADAKIGLGSEADLRSWINSKL